MRPESVLELPEWHPPAVPQPELVPEPRELLLGSPLEVPRPESPLGVPPELPPGVPPE